MAHMFRFAKIASDITDPIIFEGWEYSDCNYISGYVELSKEVGGNMERICLYCDHSRVEEYAQLACDITRYRERIEYNNQ